ncbi:hypothetical protein EB796_004176 [Bugula neritina]|uniref:Uncharacterized protein n=1 Tax=Bugula neritina TaxID=10212 RepID=A0A7J7KHY3_BUGNE|nr:hypothetical protein EB796_004176 [Bugula neritina]
MVAYAGMIISISILACVVGITHAGYYASIYQVHRHQPHLHYYHGYRGGSDSDSGGYGRRARGSDSSSGGYGRGTRGSDSSSGGYGRRVRGSDSDSGLHRLLHYKISSHNQQLPHAPHAPIHQPYFPSPADGGWSSWSTWASCAGNCGGSSVRYRSCDSPHPSLSLRQTSRQAIKLLNWSLL